MQEHIPSRRGFLGLLGATLAFPRRAHATTPNVLSGNAFGTTWHIVGPEGAELAALRSAFDALFAEIDREMSPWRADSTISRFNASATGVDASEEMIRVTQAALGLATQTDGAFDPTVGPFVARWGFGPIDGTDGGGGAPDWRGLFASGGHLVKSRGGLTLDLCGIAKGRALDRAGALAQDMDFNDLLLDLGGELVALGRHPAGRDWRVAIEHPLPGRPSPAVLHLPAGQAVATSGLGAQSYALGGRIWGHIIDPATASPVQGNLRSVTVMAPDAMTADGWATALFAAGDDRGLALARDNDVAALFLYDAGTDLRRVETGGIGDLLT